MRQKKLTQNFSKIKFNNIDNKIFYCLITLISFSFTFYYGYLGVSPLDSFLIFDAGHKVLNGIHPFKDYWSISGPLLDYIQSILFFIFKTNWFSYVLHAALINSLLAIIVFYFFIIIELQKINLFIYSLSVSILAYPAVGTPFMDHHAVIFSLISVIYLILGLLKDRKIYWFLSKFVKLLINLNIFPLEITHRNRYFNFFSKFSQPIKSFHIYASLSSCMPFTFWSMKSVPPSKSLILIAEMPKSAIIKIYAFIFIILNKLF